MTASNYCEAIVRFECNAEKTVSVAANYMGQPSADIQEQVALIIETANFFARQLNLFLCDLRKAGCSMRVKPKGDCFSIDVEFDEAPQDGTLPSAPEQLAYHVLTLFADGERFAEAAVA